MGKSDSILSFGRRSFLFLRIIKGWGLTERKVKKVFIKQTGITVTFGGLSEYIGRWLTTKVRAIKKRMEIIEAEKLISKWDYFQKLLG